MEHINNEQEILNKEYEDIMKGFSNSSLFATAPLSKDGKFIQYSAYDEERYGHIDTTFKKEHFIDTRIVWEVGGKY
ncbi:hypothetical protein EZS27_016609 [termite gut metagenome]|uniref:Uncharacterized protein n=1 Tax=termite gut metagenome TaxID=433724 RepID=A0A5J4RPU7_9ZZZZ